MNETDSKQTVDLVFRRLTEPIHLGGQEVSPFLWLALLIPILIVGKVYIVWMYRRDARTIGWVWASLLSMLRLSVYYILAAVFLLPALQTWEETKNQSRVVVVLDGSQSMTQTRDNLPTDDTPPDKLPTRQEKVVRLLTDGQPTFLDRFVAKNPVFAYRFGKSVDEDFHVLTPEGHWTRKDWEE